MPTFVPEQRLQRVPQSDLEASKISTFSYRAQSRRPSEESGSILNSQNAPDIQRSRFRPSSKLSESFEVTAPAPRTETVRRRQQPAIETNADVRRNPKIHNTRFRPRSEISPSFEDIAPLPDRDNSNRRQQLSGESISEVQPNLEVIPYRFRSDPKIAPSLLVNAPAPESGRRHSSEEAKDGKDLPDLTRTPKPDSSHRPFQRQPGESIRDQSRHNSVRGNTPIHRELSSDRSHRRGIQTPQENEVLKPKRTRGRVTVAKTVTSAPSLSTEAGTYEQQDEQEQSQLSTTAVPPETMPVAEDPSFQETQPTEGTTRNRFQPSPARKFASSEKKSSKRPTRPLLTTAMPAAAKRANFFQSESKVASSEDPAPTIGQYFSQEETRPSPGSLTNNLVTLTTEGYTDSIVPSTENTRKASRGKARVSSDNESIGPPLRRKPSRGEVKAQLAETLRPKNGDEISDEDNYPKEFLEKIKTSAEIISSSNGEQVPRGYLNGRAAGGRSLSHRATPRTPTKRHMDSDVSESVNEDVIEQELQAIVKPKEGRNNQRTRYFGKGKVSTTTVLPSTTQQPSKTHASNVDALRQRYLDKLKQSQEERNQKLASLRPKLIKEGTKPRSEGKDQALEDYRSSEIAQNVTKGTTEHPHPSHIPFRPTHHQYKRKPKVEPNVPPSGSSAEASGAIRFRTRFSLTPRVPESNIEAATPTVSEYSRSKNRYSRLRKEELSVEAPEAKFWTTSNKAKSADSTYNFIRLRTKDLMSLGSEHVEESVANNEILETPTTPTSTSTTEATGTTVSSASQELTTKLTVMITTTGATDFVTTIQPAVESNEVLRSSLDEASSEALASETTVPDKITTGPTTLSTDAPDEKPETTTTGQQVTVSTRHRFSSRYVGSTDSQTGTEKPTMEPITVQDDPTSTLSILNSFTSSPSSDLFTSSPTSDAPIISTTLSEDKSSVIDSVMSSSRADLVTESTPNLVSATESTTGTPTTAGTTTIKTSTKKSGLTTAKGSKPVQNIKSTTVPSFLDNRPILRNIVSLFSPSSTTTKRPKPKIKPKTTKRPNKTSKKPGKPTTTSTKRPLAAVASTTEAATTAKSMTMTPTSSSPPAFTAESTSQTGNTTVSPLPLAVSAEEVINDTKEVISNKTSFGSAFSKTVPRAELDALTPESFLNTTDAPSGTSESTINISSTTEMGNVTSQPVYFEYTSSNPPRRAEIPQTTPSTTTAGDYYVFGIYPNNTVVKKRAWKTFDYEKYMSPYVIFGIYPNNTIVKKFPNGTIINDEFMTSDNEINESAQSRANSPQPSSTTSTTTSTSTAKSSLLTTTTSTVEVSDSTSISPDDTDSATPETTTQFSDDTTTQINGGSASNIISEIDDVTEPPTTIAGNSENSVDTTTEVITPSTIDDFLIDPIFFRSDFEGGDSTISPEMTSTVTPSMTSTAAPPVTSTMSSSVTTPMVSTVTTPMTSTMAMDETTVDPSLNLVLPLTIEEVQTFWNGNFSDAGNDSEARSSFNVRSKANTIPVGKGKELVSITNLAFRALSTSGTTNDPGETTTSFSFTASPEEVTSRKPRVKFVTLTPGVLVTTDVQGEDAITMSSQHVQKVTKAPTQLPNDLLTSVFGQLEEKASSPIPDILKDVGSEVEGDGLTAALARRIIALAMERAKSTTTESLPTTVLASTLEATTVSSSSSSSTTTPKATTKKKQSTRTVPNAATDASQQNSIISLPVGEDLQNVLQQLLAAQSLEPVATTPRVGTTTVESPADMEKAIENQIRLAEQVRKASRTMKKKKKKKSTTTTPAPPFRLGFLFNFFNRPSSPPAQESTRTPKKLRTVSSSPSPTLAAQLPQFLSSAPPEFNDGIEVTDESGGDAKNRGELLTAAIDVTKAVSKFMGTVINNAAHSFQTFVRGNFWGR